MKRNLFAGVLAAALLVTPTLALADEGALAAGTAKPVDVKPAESTSGITNGEIAVGGAVVLTIVAITLANSSSSTVSTH